MQIEIFMSARGLKNLETFVTEDTRCSLFEFAGNTWVFRGATEILKKTLNPDYETGILFPFFFEKTQKVKFVI
jgi:hypothetical protein